jgi:hypothetical protein
MFIFAGVSVIKFEQIAYNYSHIAHIPGKVTMLLKKAHQKFLPILVITGVILSMSLSNAAAIRGEADITPIESNIAAKFWVSRSATAVKIRHPAHHDRPIRPGAGIRLRSLADARPGRRIRQPRKQ